MEQIEREMKTIIDDAMTQITTERIEHQKKCVALLEQKMFDNDGTPYECELFGVKPMAIGADKVQKTIDRLDIKHEVIDATIDATEQNGLMGLMTLIPCGHGHNIYDALNSFCMMTTIMNQCEGLLVRVPCTATHQETNEDFDGLVTALLLERTISVVTRLPDNKTNTVAYDMDDYALGKVDRKLIDALYLAYTLPLLIKQHDSEFHDMVLTYMAWKARIDGATDSDE